MTYKKLLILRSSVNQHINNHKSIQITTNQHILNTNQHKAPQINTNHQININQHMNHHKSTAAKAL